MGGKVPSRNEAFSLLKKYTKTESLIKHGLAVEGVMRHFARIRGGDQEKWGIVGLVHDLDWDQFPEEHCKKTEEILRENDWPEEYIRAVISHGWGICNDVKPESEMEKVLYAVDELTGLVTTTAPCSRRWSSWLLTEGKPCSSRSRPCFRAASARACAE